MMQIAADSAEVYKVVQITAVKCNMQTCGAPDFWNWRNMHGIKQDSVGRLSKPGAYVTHNATKQLSDIPGGSLSDDMQLPLEPQRAPYCFFHICSRIPGHLYTHFNV